MSRKTVHRMFNRLYIVHIAFLIYSLAYHGCSVSFRAAHTSFGFWITIHHDKNNEYTREAA
jgi:hypothetical protein